MARKPSHFGSYAQPSPSGSVARGRASWGGTGGERGSVMSAAGYASAEVPKGEHTTIEAAGREVRLSNPGKVYFPGPGWTKLDVAQYYLENADAVLVHLRERPGMMKRFVNGIMEEPIWQKRVPRNIPDW